MTRGSKERRDNSVDKKRLAIHGAPVTRTDVDLSLIQKSIDTIPQENINSLLEEIRARDKRIEENKPHRHRK